MPADYNAQAPAYHGIDNVKYKERGGTTVKTIAYAVNLNLKSLLDKVENYANNLSVITVPNDKGLEGSLGTTAEDRVLESTLGQTMPGVNNTLAVGITSYKRIDLYYETTGHLADGTPFKIKSWLMNVEVGKADKSNETDTNSLKFGAFSYPIKVYGDKVLNNDGTTVYVDAQGMNKQCFVVSSYPSDTGYATFGDTVPVPKKS